MYRAMPCGVVTSISCRICGLHGEHVVSYLVWPASGFRLLWAFTVWRRFTYLCSVWMVQRRQLVLCDFGFDYLLLQVRLATSWWSSTVEAWPLVQMVDRGCLIGDLAHGCPLPGLPACMSYVATWLLLGGPHWH